jgi:uncharacterized membrane protein
MSSIPTSLRNLLIRPSFKQSQVIGITFLIIFTALGFFVRLHNLGKSSFWEDEAGQALAAIQPNISDTISIERQHAMAMPLDYLISRVVASFSTSEFVMRLPAVVWGTLAIVLCYVLITRICSENKIKLALVTAFILCLSPIEVAYSQEMRFYASLLFFYLLSNILLIRALKRSSIGSWGSYVLITAIGTYFNPYAMFTLINGFFYLVFVHVDREHPPTETLLPKKHLSIQFIVSGTLLCLIFLPGYLYFGANQSFSYDLSAFIGFQDFILGGLGWQSPYPLPSIPLIGFWHILLIASAVLGTLWVVGRPTKYWLVSVFTLGTVTQILIIIGLDWYKSYFWVVRQIIQLTPMVMLLSAIGIVELIQFVRNSYLRTALLVMSFMLILVSSFPYLRAYYASKPGSAKEISQKIIATYESGEIIAVPDYFDYIFEFYLSPLRSDPIIPFSSSASGGLQFLLQNKAIRFLVIDGNTGATERDKLLGLGFSQIEVGDNALILYERRP